MEIFASQFNFFASWSKLTRAGPVARCFERQNVKPALVRSSLFTLRTNENRLQSSWVRNSYSSPTSILSSMHRNFTFRKFCLILDRKGKRKKTYNSRKKYFMLCKTTNVKTQCKMYIKYNHLIYMIKLMNNQRQSRKTHQTVYIWMGRVCLFFLEIINHVSWFERTTLDVRQAPCLAGL